MTRVDSKRLRFSAMSGKPVSKVLDSDNTSSSPAPATPLDDEDLQEILLRLPPQPSSLPRASLVCTRWRSILSDPWFLKRFRKHHQMLPLLGFFVGTNGMKHNFLPIQDKKPNRIPAERFAVPECSSPYDYWDFCGCRHGLAVFIRDCRREVVIWDPLTGQQHRIPFPPGLRNADSDTFWVWHAAVLCDDAEDGHVHGDCFFSPFKLALICGGDTQASACLYESASGVWRNIVSVVTTSTIFSRRSSVLIGNAVYWLLSRGDILAFDIEKQTLGVIEKPTYTYPIDYRSFQLLRTGDGSGLGFAVMSKLSIHLWERKMNSDGVVGWFLLQKTIQLEGIIPWRMPRADKWVLLVGYDEDTNMIILSTRIGKFMLQLESMQTRMTFETIDNCCMTIYPYRNFYTAGREVGWKRLDLKL